MEHTALRFKRAISFCLVHKLQSLIVFRLDEIFVILSQILKLTFHLIFKFIFLRFLSPFNLFTLAGLDGHTFRHHMLIELVNSILCLLVVSLLPRVVPV